MIRKTTLWALRALLHLANERPDHLAMASDIATAVGAPTNTMRKILRRLCLAGLVVSQRGASGGWLLAAPVESVSILDVARIMGDSPTTDCADAGGATSYQHLDAVLADLQALVVERLHGLTIADLGGAAAGSDPGKARSSRRD